MLTCLQNYIFTIYNICIIVVLFFKGEFSYFMMFKMQVILQEWNKKAIEIGLMEEKMVQKREKQFRVMYQKQQIPLYIPSKENTREPRKQRPQFKRFFLGYFFLKI